MAFFSSKSYLPLSSPLKIFISLLLLQLFNNSVNSQFPTPPDYESVDFGFSSFDPNDPNLGLFSDASISSAGILHLTETDYQGKALQNSVGRLVHATPVHIWDRNTGNLADFTAGFTFVVNPGDSEVRGDGFAFFLGPLRQDIPQNSTGGYLGLFDPKTALDPSKNQILAIEFDTFPNEWDPPAATITQAPHVGIDVGSVKSVATANWPAYSIPSFAVGSASINYNSETKRLSVFVSYPGISNATVSLSANVDLRSVLPEYVRVGFSAATGDVVETHDIFSFHFEAAL
ncbi:agglutinin-2-like [Arachis ipaensis]|uniref:agglutinin-2-like n=1 Tax=Arachis ipaensis TaxID=130454 RepID=UPI0007AF861A|nr:agglutinin-2-like [Arachis ipaensis]